MDIFSIGGILVYLLTGKMIFFLIFLGNTFWSNSRELESQNILQVIKNNFSKNVEPKLFSSFSDIIIKCLNYSNGYSSVTELIEDLEKSLRSYGTILILFYNQDKEISLKNQLNKDSNYEQEICLKVNSLAYFYQTSQYIQMLEIMDYTPKLSLTKHNYNNEQKEKILNILDFNLSNIKWMLGQEMDFNVNL